MDRANSVQTQSEKLLNSYTIHNLTKITSTLILLYKEKNFDVLKNIVNSISEYMDLKINSNSVNFSKSFSKLVIMYHPDKINFYHRVISKAVQEDNQDTLQSLNHIHITNNLINCYNEISSLSVGKSASAQEDDFIPDPELHTELNNLVFNFKFDQSGTRNFFDIDQEIDDLCNIDKRSFLEIYTNLGLSDKCKIAMSKVDLKNLGGVECFTDITHLNLSENKLKDISNLWYLNNLEELNLADNQIYSIFALCNLRSLRSLDLANNNIDDIRDLENLDSLEFVNLINNPIPEKQINRLRKLVKVVLF